MSIKKLIRKLNVQCISLSVLMIMLVACEPTNTSENDEPLLLEGARLISGDGGVIENGALLIEGGRIVAVGDRGSIESPPNASVINLVGKTIIPALIDAHAHLGYEGYGSWGGANYSRENLIDNLERYAYYGFSAVFSA